jgi:hypothetical protein
MPTKNELLALAKANEVDDVSQRDDKDEIAKKLRAAGVNVDDDDATHDHAQGATHDQPPGATQGQAHETQGAGTGARANEPSPGGPTAPGANPDGSTQPAPPPAPAARQAPKESQGAANVDGPGREASTGAPDDEGDVEPLSKEEIVSLRALLTRPNTVTPVPGGPSTLEQARALPRREDHDVSAARAARLVEVKEDRVLGYSVHQSAGADGKGVGDAYVVVIDVDGHKHAAEL